METHNPADFRLLPDELQCLKAFIARQGFGEPAVLLEILDHFACKVEEIWPENLDRTLQEAMDIAYRSFGQEGFYPLARAFYQSTQRRYHSLLKTAFLQVPGTLKGILLLVCTGWGYYTLHRFGVTHGWQLFERWNPVSYAVYMSILAINFGLTWERQPNPFLRYTTFRWQASVQIALLLIMITPDLWIPSAFQTGIVVLAAWYLRARAVIRKTAVSEHECLLERVYGL